MKMSCPDEERLVDYLEGRLPEKDMSRVEKHLSDCQNCLESLVIMKGIEKESGSASIQPAHATKISPSLAELAKLLENNDADASDRLEEIMAKPESAAIREDLKRLDKLISEYDFDSALKSLFDLAKQFNISL